MLMDSEVVIRSEGQLRLFVGELFEQYPGHLAHIRATRRRRRRSEFVLVRTEIGAAKIQVDCVQLAKLGEHATGSVGAVRRALVAAEDSKREPVLFHIVGGTLAATAVMCLSGPALDDKTRNDILPKGIVAIEEQNQHGSPEHLEKWVALLFARVDALEVHMASQGLAVPENYRGLVAACQKLALEQAR